MEQKKDTTAQGTIHKGPEQGLLENNLAKQEPIFDLLYKKTQKIITALYMVTDCLEDGEPLKFRLRTLGLSAISDIHSLEKERAIPKTFRFETLKNTIDESVSLVEIAGLVGLVSSMNSAILIKEFLNLKELINEKEEKNKQSVFQDPLFAARASEKIVLSQSYFSIGKEKENTLSYKGHFIKDSVLYKKQSNLKGHIEDTYEKDNKVEKRNRQSDIALKINRRNNILRLIKDKKEVMIKDISQIISDCSEKTIQRELNALVSEGVLKKIGNKRWSRYAIA